MKHIKLVWILVALLSIVYAEEDVEVNGEEETQTLSIDYDEEGSEKHSLKCNMIHLYDELPNEVDNLGDMFSQGMFYWRMRFNSFGLKWKEEIERDNGTKVRSNHVVGAIGGSLIYKSAILNGFSFGTGLYTSQGLGNLDSTDAYLYKGGKGLFSRYDLLTDESINLTSLAQAYLQYTYEDTSMKVGRQIVRSFLTKSNDTKMIPNTFEGVTLKSRAISDTAIHMAYLTKQKLRDHSDFHHVLAAGDDPDDPYTLFTQNDDSAMHFGLGLSKLQERGIDDRLVIAEVRNESVDDMVLTMNYTAVPELVSSAMLQAEYRLYLAGFTMIPGLRYMKQFDDGAGEIGGANLKTLTEGYVDPESLDSELYGARLDFVENGIKVRLGYTKIADEGDIIAPWRGFPTGGFTRSMAQYNWYANTETYMVQLDYDLGFFSDTKIISRFAVQDFDDSKVGVQADSRVIEVNFFKGLGENPIYYKARLGHAMGDDDTYAANGVLKPDPSYTELRFEVNYLF